MRARTILARAAAAAASISKAAPPQFNHALRGARGRRRHAGVIAALAFCSLFGPALGGVHDAARAATSCVVLPADGKLPPHAAEARERFASDIPEVPGGWEIRAERVRQIRKDVAANRTTAAEAARRGGLAVAGNFLVPVLPTLYNDTPTAPQASASLQLELFGPSTTGSMTDYFEEVSYGNLNVTGTVYGWERAPHPMLWYTGADNGLSSGGKAFVRDAVGRHDQNVDFGQFDNDGPDGIPNSGDDDGFVDIAVVVYPTAGAECMGGGLNMWSHHFRLSANGGSPAFTNDPSANGGVPIRVDRYFVGPANSCGGGLIEIGVFCHEMGHALGIPDLYDTDDDPLYLGDSEGIGNWGLMGAGGISPTFPSHMTAFSKERLGWLTYLNIAQDVTHLCLPPIETDPVAVRVWSQGSIGPEYFLVENRQPIGFDSMLLAPGLVIYHVNEDVYDNLRDANRVNAFETIKAIDVECADALLAGHVVDADDLDSKANRGDATDVWCAGGGARSFNGGSTPDTRAYSGAATGVAIQDAGNCSSEDGVPPGWVCADYVVGVASPVDLCVEDCDGDNCNPIATCGEYWASPNIWIDNDDDPDHEIPAPGIDNRVWVRFENLGPEALANVTVDLYAAKGTAGLEWPDDADLYLGSVGANILEAGDTAEDFLTFEYPELFDTEGHYCIGAVINNAYDPVANLTANLSNNIAQVNSQVLVARAGGAAKSMACPGPFAKDSKIYLRDGYNPGQDLRKSIIRVGTPPLFDDAVIPDSWTLSILPSTGPFFLGPASKDSITVRMTSSSAQDGQTAHVPITLWDDDLQVAIGGVTLDFVIDCRDPAVPQNGSAAWTELPGDDVEAPTVLVQWDPVLLDVLGGPETVLHYEVFRSNDGGLPYFPVDEVAIDAEPLAPGFQWFDDIPRDHCPQNARYRVRAVDAAGAVGALSDPIELPCATTGVEVASNGLPPAGRSRATPNPFRRSTAIEFSLPQAGPCAVEVFNPQGERVRTLERGYRPAGDHRLEWDGRDAGGRPVGSGIYFYRIVAPGVSETERIVLAR